MLIYSVIIPTYNRAHCIQDAINSVINQSFEDFEIIVIDDASTDNTDAVVRNIKDDRIKYYKNEENVGQSASRNSGASIAKGNYLCFLDSDDLWENDYLSSFYKQINISPNVSCFYCWLNTEKGIYKKWHLDGWIYKDALLMGELSSTITLVVARDAFLDVGGFDELISYGDDDDLCYRLAKKFEFKLIPLPLATSRSIDLNAMTKQSLSLAKGKSKLLQKYKDDILILLGKKELSKKYYELSNSYLLAADIKNFKSNLMTALQLRFENYPKILHLVVFELICILKYCHVRKSTNK